LGVILEEKENLTIQVQQNYTYPDAGYPDRLDPLGKFV